jgi:hypothetical protein
MNFTVFPVQRSVVNGNVVARLHHALDEVPARFARCLIEFA